MSPTLVVTLARPPSETSAKSSSSLKPSPGPQPTDKKVSTEVSAKNRTARGRNRRATELCMRHYLDECRACRNCSTTSKPARVSGSNKAPGPVDFSNDCEGFEVSGLDALFPHPIGSHEAEL